MLGLDAQHLPFAGLPTFMAADDGLLCRLAGVLRMGNWKKKKIEAVTEWLQYQHHFGAVEHAMITRRPINNQNITERPPKIAPDKYRNISSSVRFYSVLYRKAV